MPWFLSIKVPGCTRHSSLGTGWEFRYRQVGSSPMQPGFVTRDFLLFLFLKEQLAGYHFTCDEDSKCATVLCVTQTVYPFYDPAMTNLSQRLQTSSGLRLKVFHFVLSVSWIRSFPWLMDAVTYLLSRLLSLQKTNPFLVWNTCEVTMLRFKCLTAICKIEVLLKRRSCWDTKNVLKSVTSVVNIISKRDFYQYFSSGEICGLNICLMQGTICGRILSLINPQKVPLVIWT